MNEKFEEEEKFCKITNHNTEKIDTEEFHIMGRPLTFEVLKSIAAKDLTAQENLEDLKYMFFKDIGCTRNKNRIRTVAELLDCLERHDALSEFNIEPLREIADRYGGELANAIAYYNVPKDRMPAEPYNEYREMRLSYECANRLNINDINGSRMLCTPVVNESQLPLPANNGKQKPMFAQVPTKEKRAAIYKLIAEDIGSDWRCLGRELERRQGEMDDIEIQYRDLKTRVYKIFQAFEEDDSIDPNQHVLIICQALGECRRGDLRRKVESIMSH